MSRRTEVVPGCDVVARRSANGLKLAFLLVAACLVVVPRAAQATDLAPVGATVPTSPDCPSCLSTTTGTVTIHYMWTGTGQGSGVTVDGTAPSGATVQSVYLTGAPTGSDVVISAIYLTHGGWTDPVFQAYTDGTVTYPTSSWPKTAPWAGQLVTSSDWVAAPEVRAATASSTLQMNLVIVWQVTSTSPPPSPPPTATSVALRGIANKCLDAAWTSGWPNGTPVQLWDCTGGNNQKWMLLSDGSVRGIGGKCLDAYWTDGWPNGTPVQLWDCTGGVNQKWKLQADGSLRGVGGKCLDVDWTDGWPNGTHIQLWDCSGGNNQKWQFVSQ